MKRISITSFFILLVIALQAQPLTGVKTIPGDYATIQAAIGALNTNGVGSGGVTFNVAAGSTETLAGATSGMISYNCAPAYYSSAASPVVFQKSGGGANPLVTAFTPGTSLTTDGMIILAGADYVTFDGIDLQENPLNATPTTQMEWGYALVKKNSSAPYDGCQNVIIRNCSITLNKANTASTGIHMGCHVFNSTSEANITLPSDASSNCKFYGNNISNVYYGFDVEGYWGPTNLYDLNTEIGVTAANTITNFGGAGGNPSAVFAAYQDNFKIAGNIINGGTGTTGNLYGIYTGNGTGSNVQIYGNNITLTPGSAWVTTVFGIRNTMGSGGTTNTVNIYNNTLENFTPPSNDSWPSCLISQEANCPTANIYGNIMRNCTPYGGNYYYAIAEYSTNANAVRNIYNNQVSNITMTSGANIWVIDYNVSTTTTGNIYNNVIHGIYSVGGGNRGIVLEQGGTTNVYKNRIYDIASDGNGFSGQGLLTGIHISATTTANIYNNYVSDLKAPTTGYGYSADAIDGIYVNTATTCNILYNTIYLNASSSYTSFRTSCVNSSANTIGNILLKNNILVNLSTSTGVGNFATAYRRGISALTNYDPASDYNLFYSGIPSQNNLVYEDHTNADMTLPGFQTRVAPREAHSTSEMPPFVNAAAYDYHLVTGSHTSCESGGQVITSPFAITDDNDGNPRYPNAGYPNNVSYPASAPDIGADEFAGGGGDNTPPNIIYTPLTDPTDNNPRTLTALIYDAGMGVPVSNAGLPMLYWKKTGDPGYTGVQGVSNGAGQYTFTFGGGVSSGNTVYYYIAAQDLITPANVSAFPSAGATGFTSNPPAVSTPPSSPSTYNVQSPLVGIWTIPGNFATIQAAIATLNFRGVGVGGVTFNIAANYTETFTSSDGGLINYTCNPLFYSSSTNPVVFQKSGTGANPLVTAFTPGTSTSTDGIIKIAGGDYITIDGLDLQENPANTTPTMQMEWGYALVKKNAFPPYDGCQNVIIRNCTITLNKSNTASVGINMAAMTANSNATLGISNGPADANNNCKIYGNTISNAYTGISLSSYAYAVSGYDLGNEVGVTAPNTISNFGGGTIDAEAIYINFQHNVKVYNNNISGGTGTTANNLYGIYVANDAGATFDISGNYITLNGATQHGYISAVNVSGNTAVGTININNNTIENIVNTQSIDSYIRCIYQNSAANTININGNIIRNIAKPGAGTLEGIYAFYGATGCVESIANNQVYNLTSPGTAIVYGIDNWVGQYSTATVTGNLVHGLSSSSSRNAGIFNAWAQVLNMSKNRIYDITCLGGYTNGIYFTSITTANVWNNFISDLKAPTSNNGFAVVGLFFPDGTTVNLFNNTVYLNAASSFLNFSTACAYVANNATGLSMKNNVLVNMSTSTALNTYAVSFFRTGPSLTNYDPASNNNLFYAGNPGPHNLIFNDNNTQYQTLASFQAAVTPRETNSATELPPFADAANNNLHLLGNVETHCESGGIAISSPFAITDDYDGDPRYPNAGYPVNPLDPPTAPDMGADEFGGGHYHTPPVIAYTPLPNPITNNAQTLTATITDPTSGVPVSGSGLPVLYWKKKGSPSYTAVQGTSIGSSQYTFTFGSGVVSADSVFYYIAAQGTWVIPNIGVYPSMLASGFSANPPAVSTPPLNPSSYAVQSPLAGTIYVGGASVYPSLTGPGGLFQGINTVGLAGNLVAVVQGDLTEPGTYSLNPWSETGAGNYKLAIQPDGTTQRKISGTAVANYAPMVNINGADRVTINGGSGKNLLFRNTNSIPVYAGPAIQFTSGAVNDTLRNCVAETNGTSNTLGTVTIGNTGTNSIYIGTCDIHDATGGTTGYPVNALYSNSATNIVNLQGNNFSNFTSTAICLANVANGCILNANNIFEATPQAGILYGIYINAGSGHTITANNFGGSNATRTGAALSTTSGIYGIYLSVGTAGPTSVQGNTLSNFGTSGSSTSLGVYGVYMTNGNINVGNITGNTFGGGALASDTIRNAYDNGIIYSSSPGIVDIENNTIGNISYYKGGNDRTAGMYIIGGTVNVKGNTIRDIKGNSSGTSNAYLVEGIHFNSGGTLVAPVIEGNTFSNIWNFNPGTSTYTVIAINLQTANVPNATVRNNKITNLWATGTGTGSNSPVVYGIYNGGTSCSLYNNMISLGQGGGAPETRIYGIMDGSTTGATLYFNSVNINGTGSGANTTYAFYAAGNSNYTLKDNIFYNIRSGIGACAIGTTYPSSVTSNYNDLYTTGTLLGTWGATNCANLAAWRTASLQDLNSVSGEPNFVSLADLHINTALGSPVSDAGIAIPGITTDFDYATRNNPPDIGADDYTLPSTVTTLAATLVTCTSATLNGTINANNQGVVSSFDYGTTLTYGNSAAATPASVTGSTVTPVSAALTPLIPGTLYHYRAVGTVGIVPFYGADMTFTTGSLTAAAGSIAGASGVCKGSTGVAYSVPLIPHATTYIWTVPSGATIATGSGTSAITVDYSASATSGNVAVYGTNSCGNGPAATFPVTVNDLPVPTLSGAATACVNAAGNVYTTQAGMTGYSWNVPAGGTITSGGTATSSTVTVNWTTPGVKTVSVSYTSAGGCTAATPATFSVTVNALPVPTLAGPASVCQNSTGNLYTTQAGMTGYSWTVSGGGTITSGGTATSSTVTVNWNSAGAQAISVSYTNASGCTAAAPATYNITVNPLPVPAVTGAATACAGTTGNVYTTQAGMTGYNWTVSAGGTLTAGGTATSNTATVTWNTPGVQTISVNYADANGCSAAAPTVKNVTVNALPLPTITGTAGVCAGTTGVTYSTESGMTGYSWSVSPGGAITAGSGTNTVTVNWNTAGAQTLSVSYTNGNGCTAATQTVKNITVNPLPVPTITGNGAACTGSTGIVYTTEAGMTGYSWVISAGGTITAGAGTSQVTVNWNTAGAQTLTVNYTNGNGCTATTATVKNVTVNSVLTPTVTGPASTCAGATGVTYYTESGMTAYSWIISAGGIITSGGSTNTITVNWSTTGAQTLTVNYSNTFGCAAGAPTVYNVTVNPLPVPTITGTAAACAGSAGNTYTTETGKSGYTWTISPGGSIMAGAGTSSVTVSWNTAGAQTLSVNYASAAGCTAATATVKNITVNPLPLPSMTGAASVCQNSTGNVYTTDAGMTGYTWNISAGGTLTAGGTATSNTATVTWNTTGAQTVSVLYTNGNGCTAASATVYNVTVNARPAPAVTGPATVCANAPGNVYTTQAGMTGYIWNISAGGTLTAGGTANSNTATVTWNTPGAQTISVNYTNGSGCAAVAPVVYNVTVNPLPVATVTGPTAVCAGTAGNIYTTQAGMTGYSWTVSAGGILTAGGTATSSTATVTWNTAGAQSVGVTYANANGCAPATPANAVVAVTALPVPTLTGPLNTCINATGNVYTTQAGMTGYNWTVSAGGTITAGGTATSSSVTVTWISTGPQTVSVTYSNTGGCAAVSPATASVTVNPLPVPLITGPATACTGIAGNTYTTQAGMTGYTWTVSAGGTITAGAGTSAVTVTWNTAGAQTVSVNYTSAAGCAAAAAIPYNVTVNTTPAPTVSGPATLCAGAAGNIYTTQAGMTGYTWTVSAGGTITAGAGTSAITVTWNTAGAQTVSVNYSNGTGCSAAAPASYPVTVNALPVPAITGPASACSGSTGNSYTTQAGMTGYAWTVSAGGTITAGAGTSAITVSWNTTGPQTVGVTYTSAAGCAAAAPAVYNITVSLMPAPTISGTGNLCQNSGNYFYTTETGMSNYQWAVSPGGTIVSGTGTSQLQVTWNSAGAQWVSVNYTNANGCSGISPTQYNVTVNPVPAAAGAITGVSYACGGTTGLLYNIAPVANATTYFWQLPAGASITSGMGSNSITVSYAANASSGNITVYANNLCGNGIASPAFPVTVTALPDAASSVNGPATVCQGENGVVYTVGAIANATSYVWTVPAGASIVSGANTSSITVDYGTGAGSGNVLVYGSNSCGNGTASPVLAVAVNPVPAAPVITASGALLSSSAPAGNQWYFEGTAIAGQTGQTCTATHSGWYWSVVTLGGCSSDTSNHRYVVMTGVAELQPAGCTLYPVPNDGRFTISITSPVREVFTLSVFNDLGVMISRETGIEVEGTVSHGVDLRPAAPGMYTVVLQSAGYRMVRKMVVQQ